MFVKEKSIYKLFPKHALFIRDLQSLIANPIFIFGIILRISIIFFHKSILQKNLFIPFIINNINSISIDPWKSFISNGGKDFAFPYSISMVGILSPPVYIGNLLDKFFDISYFSSIAFNLTTLFFDFILLICILLSMQKIKTNLVLITYWLSPYVIYITYWHGQIDIVPVSIMFISLFLITKNKYILSAIFLTISIFCKFSMVLALPFSLIYIFKKRGINTEIMKYLITFLALSFLFFTPFSNLEGYQMMVLGSKEVAKLYTLNIAYGNNLKLYITPLIYLLSLYLVWRLRRLTNDLFIISIGVSFFTFLIFIPPAPAWFLWCIPFLTYYQVKASRDIFVLGIAFNFLVIVNASLNSFINYEIYEFSDIKNLILPMPNQLLYDLSFSLQQAVVVLLAIRMYVYGLTRNNFYGISEAPIMISISGEISNTLEEVSKSLSMLFSKNLFKLKYASNFLNELNYSVNNSIYKLNNKPYQDKINFEAKNKYFPEYNHIKKKNQNSFFLWLKKLIPYKPEYIMLIENKPFIFNYLKKIINLRVLISSKENSDKDLEIISKNDSEKSLLLYFDNSNHIKNKNPKFENNSNKTKLTIYLPTHFIHDQLLRLTIAICPINVDSELTANKKYVKMTFDGQTSANDIKAMAENLIPNIDDLNLEENSWEEGYLGIIQIVFLSHIAELLQKNNSIVNIIN